jgi:elongation factor 1-gamma
VPCSLPCISGASNSFKISFGKLYGSHNRLCYLGNSRSTVLLVIAKENNLGIKFAEVKPPKVDAEYLKLNPLALVPTFVGTDGLLLTEVMAIAIYCKFC